jgi:hypothetical protein
VLAGDQRLTERFGCDELAPLGSRMRVKLVLDRATPDELWERLVHAPSARPHAYGKRHVPLIDLALSRFRNGPFLINMLRCNKTPP